MSDEKKRPEEQPQPEVEEVVTDLGEVRVRSGFQIEEFQPGVLGINIFGPVLEFLDDEDDDLDLEHEEGSQEGHGEEEE